MEAEIEKVKHDYVAWANFYFPNGSMHVGTYHRELVNVLTQEVAKQKKAGIKFNLFVGRRRRA